MNVLLLTTHLNKGGVARYVINLAKGLRQRGSMVWVSSSGGEWARELSSFGVEFAAIPIKTKSMLSPKIFFSFCSLIRLIKKKDINIIHSNTRVTQCLGFLLSAYCKVPYVGAFHGFYKAKTSRGLFKFSGTKTIAVSNSVKDHLRDDLEIDPDNITVVHNGIDLSTAFNLSGARADWGLLTSDFLIGILGRLSAEKGHNLALEAFELLHSRYEHIYLLMCGQGKMKESLKQLIDKKGLSSRVRFLDCSSDEFLSNIDVLLVPSQKEGFGYSIIEAFAKGAPVIGYNTGGIAEIIRDGVNGILFNQYNGLVLADRIEELLLKKELRARLVAKAKEDVYNFSLERMAQKTEAVYQLAIEKYGRN